MYWLTVLVTTIVLVYLDNVNISFVKQYMMYVEIFHWSRQHIPNTKQFFLELSSNRFQSIGIAHSQQMWFKVRFSWWNKQFGSSTHNDIVLIMIKSLEIYMKTKHWKKWGWCWSTSFFSQLYQVVFEVVSQKQLSYINYINLSVLCFVLLKWCQE